MAQADDPGLHEIVDDLLASVCQGQQFIDEVLTTATLRLVYLIKDKSDQQRVMLQLGLEHTTDVCSFIAAIVP